MRLLQRQDDGNFALTHNFLKEEELPKYATLSHTWLAKSEEEVNFDDIENGNAQRKSAGYAKIQFCGEQAARDGLQYFWVDTCCIDKTSSQELQEAIATMYQWYRKATRCYVYLSDVSVTEDEVNHLVSSPPWEAALRSSRWFTRGWTLQELLAPTSVDFYSVQGTRLGDKRSLQQCIHEITGVPHRALQGERLANFTVAERLSWAQNRQTTRREDKAYALLGLFSIFMPLMYGEGDHALIRLQKQIDKKNAEEIKLNNLLDTIPTTPSAAFNSPEIQYRPRCLANTRVELLRHITDWADGLDDECIFLLNGIAGMGKSTIARTIASVYYDRGHLGGTFFFSRGGGDASHAHTLFTTLASQLANVIPSTRRHICEAIKEHKDMSQYSLQDQWNHLIISPLSKLESDSCPSTIVFILDALDECDDETDIHIIMRTLATARVLKNIRLRIFITSRPEIIVRWRFQQILAAEFQAFVLHDIAPQVEDQDLTVFFEDKLTDIREERGLSMDWPGCRVVPRLVETSCGLVIWASTACLYIHEEKHFAEKRIQELINGRHSGADPEKRLDQIYITILQDSIRQDYGSEKKTRSYESLREVLGSIITLVSPLSMDSLVSLTHVKAESFIQTVASLQTIFIIPIQSNSPIRLQHPTFRDFLLDKKRCTDLDFWIDAKKAHRFLAQSCIRLMSKMLKRNICGLYSPGVFVKDIGQKWIEKCIPPELRYACLYWVEHYRQGEARLRDNDSVHRFYQQHFLHWLEVVSLMGKASEMAAIIRMYQSLLRPADNACQLSFVKNSRRFIFAFQSKIEQVPLQIYCAALAFSHPSVELRCHSCNQMHERLKDVRIAESITPEVKDEFNYVNDLAFTPDSRKLASGSIREWVRIWDVTTKAPVTKFEGQADKVSSVAISPDGILLASGSDDATVMVWDTKSKVVHHKLTGHTRWVNAVIFSPDGKLLASGSMDETIRLWNIHSGKLVSVLEANSSCVNSIAFSPDGLLIASGTVDQMIRLWDLEKGEILKMLVGHSGPVNAVQFSANGNRIVSGSDDMTIRLWNALTGAETMRFTGHSKKIWAVTFSRDCSLIASGSEDKTIRLWNASTGGLLNTLTGHTSGINAVVYSPDGRFLASGSFDDEVRLWDAKTGEKRGKLADFVDDANSGSSLATKLDLSKFDEGLQHSFPDSSMAMSEVLVAHPSISVCSDLWPSGQSNASDLSNAKTELWTQDGAENQSFQRHLRRINDSNFLLDSQQLGSGSVDQLVKLRDPRSGTMLHTFEGHSDHVRFSSDNELYASYSTDTTISLWQRAIGATLSNFGGHLDAMNRAVCPPHNRLITSDSAEMTKYLWDVLSATKAPEELGVYEEFVRSVASIPHGKLLVPYSSDRKITTSDITEATGDTAQEYTLLANSTQLPRDMTGVVSCSRDRDLASKSTQSHQRLTSWFAPSASPVAAGTKTVMTKPWISAFTLHTTLLLLHSVLVCYLLWRTG